MTKTKITAHIQITSNSKICPVIQPALKCLCPFRSVLPHVLAQIAYYAQVTYGHYVQKFTTRKRTKKIHAIYCQQLNHKEHIIKCGGLMKGTKSHFRFGLVWYIHQTEHYQLPLNAETGGFVSEVLNTPFKFTILSICTFINCCRQDLL